MLLGQLRFCCKAPNTDQSIGHKLKAHRAFSSRAKNIQEPTANRILACLFNLGYLPISMLVQTADDIIDIVFLIFGKIKEGMTQLDRITGFLNKTGKRNKTETQALLFGIESTKYTHALMPKVTLIGMALHTPERKCLKTGNILLKIAVHSEKFLPLMQAFRVRDDQNQTGFILGKLIMMSQSRSQPTSLTFLKADDLQLFSLLFGRQKAVVKT
jgi:hypothetical protein